MLWELLGASGLHLIIKKILCYLSITNLTEKEHLKCWSSSVPVFEAHDLAWTIILAQVLEFTGVR